MDASLEAEPVRSTSGRLRWAILGAVAVGFVAVGMPLFRATSSGQVRSPAPAFALPSLDGKGEIRLEQYRGWLLVINFWASWCDPCREEAPLFASAAGRERGVAFLGMDVMDGREDALKFVDEFDLPYAQAVDHRGVVLHRYRVTGVPETFFVDRSGYIVGHFIGAFHGNQLDDAVRRFKMLRRGDILEFKGSGRQLPVG